MKKKQIIIITILAAVLITLGLILGRKGDDAQVADTEPKTVKLCFYSEGAPNVRGFYDVAWIRMDVTGDQVIGEFKNLPAETDSKVGTFTGTITPVDTVGNQMINAWWDSMAEGMRITEQLTLKMTPRDISAGFAPMVDRGDGTYVYSDPANIPFWKKIQKVDCGYFSEKVDIKEYVREHIAEIIGELGVLGGTWYLIQATIDPDTNTGSIIAEDGHIQKKFQIEYTIDPSGAITVTKLTDK